MNVLKPKRTTVTIVFSIDEAAMLHRIVCTGMLGGDSGVQSSLYVKLERANAEARLGRTVLIEITGAVARPDDAEEPAQKEPTGGKKAQFI